MAPYKVMVTDYITSDFDIEQEVLAPIGAELVSDQCSTTEQVIALGEDVDGVLNTYFGPISDQILTACPKIKIVVRYGIGVDTIDIPACTRHGVMVANVPDYCLHEVSDHALGLWLTLGRKIAAADRGVRRGEWAFQHLKPVRNFRGQTAGIIGVGRIGRLTAQKLAAFGVEVLFADPYVEEAELQGIACRKVDLAELCRQSDAIFVHAPANAETHHLLNADVFAQMTKAPIIINTARAPLIDTNALVTALQAGQVGSAGLDLVDNESLPADHPLLHMDNVVITPHIAWYSEESNQELRRKATEEIVRVLQGEKPRNLLNPEVVPR